MLPVALVFSFGGSVFIEQMQGQVVEIEELVLAGKELTEEQVEIKAQWDEMQPFMAPSDQDLQDDLDVYRSDYVSILKHRAPLIASFHVQSTLAFILWRVGGLMLIGLAMMKLGILSGQRDAVYYKKMVLIGYGLGLPIVLFSAINLYTHEFDSLHLFRVGMIPNYIGSILVALGHIGAVMLLVKAKVCAGLMRRFSAVGRMALSNYLMHSVILTTLFYGYGLGLYGEIPRFAQMAFVVGVIGLQLVISPWWLQRYRFGPVEWLWSSLTYFAWQPLKNKS
jgi:uncharacterized protein